MSQQGLDAVNYKEMLAGWQDTKTYQDLNWTGSFNDYLNLVKTNPKVTRNAFQRMYDMIMEYGTEEYVDVKKQLFITNFLMMKKTAGKMRLSVLISL